MSIWYRWILYSIGIINYLTNDATGIWIQCLFCLLFCKVLCHIYWVKPFFFVCLALQPCDICKHQTNTNKNIYSIKYAVKAIFDSVYFLHLLVPLFFIRAFVSRRIVFHWNGKKLRDCHLSSRFSIYFVILPLIWYWVSSQYRDSTVVFHYSTILRLFFRPFTLTMMLFLTKTTTKKSDKVLSIFPLLLNSISI